jgi:hypothetical protein
MGGREPARYVPSQPKAFLYTRSAPPEMLQGNEALCWATSLQAWLKVLVHDKGEKEGAWDDEADRRAGIYGTPWRRREMTLKDMKNQWGDLTNQDKSLTPEGIKVVAIDVGMGGDRLRPPQFTAEYARQRLTMFSQLYVLYFSYRMYHAIVAYGFEAAPGKPLELLVMDPAHGIMHRSIDFFQEPHRVAQPMFVGWALP